MRCNPIQLYDSLLSPHGPCVCVCPIRHTVTRFTTCSPYSISQHHNTKTLNSLVEFYTLSTFFPRTSVRHTLTVLSSLSLSLSLPSLTTDNKKTTKTFLISG